MGELYVRRRVKLWDMFRSDCRSYAKKATKASEVVCEDELVWMDEAGNKQEGQSIYAAREKSIGEV